MQHQAYVDTLLKQHLYPNLRFAQMGGPLPQSSPPPPEPDDIRIPPAVLASLRLQRPEIGTWYLLAPGFVGGYGPPRTELPGLGVFDETHDDRPSYCMACQNFSLHGDKWQAFHSDHAMCRTNQLLEKLLSEKEILCRPEV
jgi:hypothetical protein